MVSPHYFTNNQFATSLRAVLLAAMFALFVDSRVPLKSCTVTSPAWKVNITKPITHTDVNEGNDGGYNVWL